MSVLVNVTNFDCDLSTARFERMAVCMQDEFVAMFLYACS